MGGSRTRRLTQARYLLLPRRAAVWPAVGYTTGAQGAGEIGCHGRFDVVLVWASDRIARSVKHFLDVLDDLSRINIEYINFRKNIDTGGPLGRAIIVIIGAVAELERNLIIERVRAGMRRALSKASA
ncbi:MAG: recombinase family protein [Terracidiphilus sp.]|jgi:hypothetical protein